MNKYLKILFVILITNSLSSCNTHTSISYREHPSQEDSKQDGYMFGCFVDGGKLIIETYTPESWGEEFYYDFLEGKKTKHTITIIDAKIKFTKTSDKLNLKEIRQARSFIYTSKDFNKIIKENEQLRLTLYMKQDNDTTTIIKSFLLYKYEDAYTAGTLPHS